MELVRQNGLPLLISAGLSKYDEIIHGFSTRRGGVSRGPFATLNLGMHTSDEPDRVLENRRRFAVALKVNTQDWVVPKQVHGKEVAVIRTHANGIVADSIVTCASGLLLTVSVADCVSVLLYDPMHHAVAAIHAGWQGAALGVVQETLRRMHAYCDTAPEDCIAAVGPAIGPCCYEVGEEIATRFPSKAIERTSSGKWHLDLQFANVRQLLDAGVLADRIDRCTWCTKCRADLFFSHRGDSGITGRMMAAIAIRGKDEEETMDE